MYINFWYPICQSKELSNQEPLRSELLGMGYVAFRDSQGKPHVLADTCVHRGGSLSKGKIIDDCVACPYHGWQFGGDGVCEHVPFLGEGVKPPARAKVDSYPVEERYGIVFAFLGDLPEEERPPLYTIEEYDDPEWREHEMVILEINCFYERSMENGVDPVHNEFVHPAQGSPQTIEGSIKLHESEWGSGVTGRYTEIGKKRTDKDGMKSDPSELNAGTWTHGPNTLITWITFKETASLHQYFFEAPINGDKTKIYFVNMRNFRLEEKYDESIRNANINVTQEDISVLENLYPVRTPEVRTKEILTPGDQAVVRYRDHLDDWKARGWRLDWKTLQENKGDIAYAIPSPARKNSGNWVLDTVPLQPVTAKQAENAA
jgi:phenylpropionate dioxygenase-like ring-hydroxylating dioxygenase large terminal subunit